MLCFEEAIENTLVNNDFADVDYAELETEYEQTENDLELLEGDQTSVLDEIRIDSVNTEISAAWKEINETQLEHLLVYSASSSRTRTDLTFNQLEEDLYSTTNHCSLENLTIQMGTSDLPRFACSAHKMNVAVRRAVTSHKPLSKMLRKLSKFSATIKSSVNLSKTFLSKKCCVRCENATRWGSSFLMLWSYIKAYKAGTFNGTLKCPYSREKIELYFQILKPVYRFNLFVQRTDSTICEVLPFVATLIHSSLERMVLTGDGKNMSHDFY